MGNPNIVNARLRVPKKLHKILVILAKQSERSLNRQICTMLQEHVTAIVLERRARMQPEKPSNE